MPVSELFNLPTLYASSRLVKPCVLIIIIIIIIIIIKRIKWLSPSKDYLNIS